MPEEKSKYEKILKQQARRLSNFTGCKLNQAQRSIAIDFYDHKSLKHLKVSLETGTAPSDILQLLEFDGSDAALISLQRQWIRINTAFDSIEYLKPFERIDVLACILNLPSDELQLLVSNS
ncbi:hypothetical protein AAEU28_02015 [Pseudoalteromonas sp. SS15]|uniref:hypothetical protein n=1 Tax=Pseudoalteromonas sp. SS15 TaxID=3139393 RepID=UPI003BACE672